VLLVLAVAQRAHIQKFRSALQRAGGTAVRSNGPYVRYNVIVFGTLTAVLLISTMARYGVYELTLFGAAFACSGGRTLFARHFWGSLSISSYH
jgi:hypothetical protein